MEPASFRAGDMLGIVSMIVAWQASMEPASFRAGDYPGWFVIRILSKPQWSPPLSGRETRSDVDIHPQTTTRLNGARLFQGGRHAPSPYPHPDVQRLNGARLFQGGRHRCRYRRHGERPVCLNGARLFQGGRQRHPVYAALPGVFQMLFDGSCSRWAFLSLFGCQKPRFAQLVYRRRGVPGVAPEPEPSEDEGLIWLLVFVDSQDLNTTRVPVLCCAKIHDEYRILPRIDDRLDISSHSELCGCPRFVMFGWSRVVWLVRVVRRLG